MANFITAYRSAVNAPNAPFVIATSGFNGWAASGGQLTVINAQLAVANRDPEFAGNVKTMETRGYWREPADRPPISQGYHYNHNSETYLLTGDAMARGMLELLGTDAANDYETWKAIYSPADLTDPAADYDGDGMTNDAERAFGLDPTSGSSVNPISVPLNAAAGTLTYTRRNSVLTGLGYSYQWSDSFAYDGWTTFTPASEAASGDQPGGVGNHHTRPWSLGQTQTIRPCGCKGELIPFTRHIHAGFRSRPQATPARLSRRAQTSRARKTDGCPVCRGSRGSPSGRSAAPADHCPTGCG